MNQWFRLYAEFATDPKVQMMSEAYQRRFIMLLCMRCGNDDVTLHDDEVAFQLRISTDEWVATKAAFIAKDLIGEDNSPLAWDRRQFRSDSSAERVRKHREGKKKAGVTRNVTETPPEADTEADTDNPSIPVSGSDTVVSAPEPESPPPLATRDAISIRATELTVLLHRRGATLQASDPRVRKWAETGITDAQALTALDTALQRRSEKGSSQAIGAGLLDAILQDQRAPPTQRQGQQGPRAMTRDQLRTAAAMTRLSDVMNDDGTMKPQGSQAKDITDERTLAAAAPRLLG